MSREHYQLYTSAQIGPLTIPNRFVRSGAADSSHFRLRSDSDAKNWLRTFID